MGGLGGGGRSPPSRICTARPRGAFEKQRGGAWGGEAPQQEMRSPPRHAKAHWVTGRFGRLISAPLSYGSLQSDLTEETLVKANHTFNRTHKHQNIDNNTYPLHTQTNHSI